MAAIEQQILNSLQLNESSKAKNNLAEQATIQSIKTRVPGNGICVDCDALSKPTLFNNRKMCNTLIDL